MAWFDLASYGWFLTFVQTFGVAATVMVRLYRGTDEERAYQGVFLVGLVLVGLATLAGFMLRTCSCVISGVVLATMLLGVTCDFSGAGYRSQGASFGE